MKGKVLKVLKYILPLAGIILFVIAASWLQRARPAGNSSNSPEDALKEALGSNPTPMQVPAMADAVSDAGDISGLLQGQVSSLDSLEASAEMPDGNPGLDTTEFFLTGDLPLHDLYAGSGQTVRFRIYHPGATNHTWEYYDMDSRKWLPAEGNTGEEADASGRLMAYADFVAPADQQALMIRCLYVYGTADAGGQVSEIAYLKTLPQEISQLSLAGDVSAEAGSLLASCDTTVEVTYMDGSSEMIEGLYGLYFMESSETEESEFLSIDGILTERKVQTVINRFQPYYTVPKGETTVTLAYIPGGGSAGESFQLSGTITGTDKEPPEVTQVDMLNRKEISDSEEEISLLVSAEDNVTPYPDLQYALVQKDTDTAVGDVDAGKIAEEEWSSGPVLTLQLRKDSNSVWFLGCRDQAGNVSFYKYGGSPEITANLTAGSEDVPEADTQAPVIRKIYVEAAK